MRAPNVELFSEKKMVLQSLEHCSHSIFTWNNYISRTLQFFAKRDAINLNFGPSVLHFRLRRMYPVICLRSCHKCGNAEMLRRCRHVKVHPRIRSHQSDGIFLAANENTLYFFLKKRNRRRIAVVVSERVCFLVAPCSPHSHIFRFFYIIFFYRRRCLFRIYAS